MAKGADGLVHHCQIRVLFVGGAIGTCQLQEDARILGRWEQNQISLCKAVWACGGIFPTGWTYSTPNKSKAPSSSSMTKQHLISSKTSGRFSVHGVPYSEHSSFPELVDCLRCLKPKKITTTVSVSKSEEHCRI